jgi:hypothetical protein
MSQSRFEDEDDVIAAFWQQYEHLPGISRKKITNYKGDGTMYDTDTRSIRVTASSNLPAHRGTASSCGLGSAPTSAARFYS